MVKYITILIVIFTSYILYSKTLCFEKTDKLFDDHGPGSYVYPLDGDNLYEYNTFDIVYFGVYETKNEIYFKVRVNGKLNKEGIPTDTQGWNFQLIDIYIDTNHTQGIGFTEALPGRHVRFSTHEAWDKVIIISPLSGEEMREQIKKKTEHFYLKDLLDRKIIIVPDFYFVSESTIIAKVLKKDVGIPDGKWGYQVLMMGFDKNNFSPGFLYNMDVTKVATTATFGGGNDFYGNPNVLDILERYPGEQEKVLSNYESYARAKYNKYALIPMIYNSKKNKKDTSVVNKNEKVPKKRVSDGFTGIFEDTEENKKISWKIMKELLEVANEYWKHHKEDRNVTVYDLFLNGYIKEIPKYPAGWKYDIFGEETGKLGVRCYNDKGILYAVYKEE